MIKRKNRKRREHARSQKVEVGKQQPSHRTETTEELDLANQPQSGSRQSFTGEISNQFRTILITSVITVAVTSFLPEWIKLTIRYGLLYAFRVTWQSWTVIGITLFCLLLLYFGLRKFLSAKWRVALAISAWLLVVGGAEVFHLWKPVHGREPTIAFFGFLRSGEDGSLRAVPELDNVAQAFYDELAATKREHPCSANDIFGFSYHEIDPFFLGLNSRSSIEQHIRRHYPDAQIGIWAFVGSTGNIEEVHVVPLIENLISDHVTLDRASEQTMRAFNHDPSTRMAAARFGARTFGAIFGYAPATVLSDYKKDKDLPMVCAAASEVLIKKARGFLEPLPGFQDDLKTYESYWDPTFVVMRGYSHEKAGRYDLAAAVFAQAATMNPFFPYTTRENYLAALGWVDTKEQLMTQAQRTQEVLKEFGTSQQSVEQVINNFRGQVPQPYGPGIDAPVLVSLMEVLRKTSGNEEAIEGPFTYVSTKWPKEPLIWLHWGDWYREIMLVVLGANSGTLPKKDLYPELLQRLEPAMVRYKKAVELDPNCEPAIQRLVQAYLAASQWDSEHRDHWLHEAQVLMSRIAQPK